ncbi:MAG: polyphosphate kinase 1 [Colwellia sp.]|nr:polyphosphate kinase 1 [Colwellia sp.]
MFDNSMFFDKELSWLAFNDRVLQEAADNSVPIIERIRFLGIYSANLDEFFRVRVADIRRRAMLENVQKKDEKKWTLLHSNIIKKVNTLTRQFKTIVDLVFTELEQKNIHVIFNDEKNITFSQKLSNKQIDWLEHYFDNRIIRHITPIIIQSKTQLSSYIDDDGIYFLVALRADNKTQFCLVEIPRDEIERFIVLPDNKLKNKHIVLLDDVVHYFIEKLFLGFIDYKHIEAYSIKLTLDAAYNLTDDLDESLLDQISKGLKQRLKADLVRLVYDQNMPTYMTSFLRKSLKIKELDNLVAGGRYRHFKDFVHFPNLGHKDLEKPEIKSLDAQRFSHYPSVFEAISQRDILLHYPYHKFRHFTEFLRQASYDPAVRQIKINIYRVAKHSRIIHSLMEAVKNGKKVTVVVELRARFDEQANIEWAKLMKDAGINVELGIDTLKIHAKLCLITRIEHEKVVKYAHIGTGNFHESNARIYTDFSLFTQHKEICQEVENVFSFVAHSYKRFRFNHLIVSPLTCRRRLYQLIDNEIQQVEEGNRASIKLKVNNLVDSGLINKLYSASKAGVKIKLIIRGMCALIPGVKGVSDNIKVISIIDLLLEHSRVMIFHNSGEKAVFISSADWMERNIDQRVEVACPIYDAILKQRIIDIFDLQFKDNVKARLINQQQNNTYHALNKLTPIRSQIAIHQLLIKHENQDEILVINDSTHEQKKS